LNVIARAARDHDDHPFFVIPANVVRKRKRTDRLADVHKQRRLPQA
jgi:hypothetical protein